MKKIILIAAVFLLSACSKVTLENYEQIQVGMDKKQIEAILGNASQCDEKTLHTNCTWGDDSKNIKVTFVADKVTLFSEQGL